MGEPGTIPMSRWSVANADAVGTWWVLMGRASPSPRIKGDQEILGPESELGSQEAQVYHQHCIGVDLSTELGSVLSTVQGVPNLPFA